MERRSRRKPYLQRFGKKLQSSDGRSRKNYHCRSRRIGRTGRIGSQQIHIPGIMIQRIFQGEKFEKRIEQRTVRKRD
jgi:hypothetical protein